MNPLTHDVLLKALAWAKKEGTPIVLASTTGETASRMLDLLENERLRLIVVTHEGWGAPREWRFDPSIHEKLLKAGHGVLWDRKALLTRIVVWFSRTFGLKMLSSTLAALEDLLGAGGQVCFKITKRAFQEGLVRAGDRVIAVAGKISGANTALAFKVTNGRPFKASLLEVIALPDEGNRDE